MAKGNTLPIDPAVKIALKYVLNIQLTLRVHLGT